MPFSLILSLLPTYFGVGFFAQSDQVRTLVVHEEVIMRVPVRSFPRSSNWDEKKGPKCIATNTIRGAMLSGREHVDFMLLDRTRMRARLSEDCPALDFYNGFYLTPEKGKICARRDEIRSRMGSTCRIEKFHRLVPKVSH